MYSIINTYFARTKEIFYLNIFHLIIYLDNSMQFFSNKCDHEGANFVVLNGFRTHLYYNVRKITFTKTLLLLHRTPMKT